MNNDPREEEDFDPNDYREDPEEMHWRNLATYNERHSYDDDGDEDDFDFSEYD